MSTTRTVSIPASLTVVVTLSQLLQRLEGRPAGVSAGQFRTVAQRLSDALRDAPPGEALEAILGTFPVAAELYENLQYEHAGLCRSPLEPALNAELAARQALQRAAGR